MCNLTLQSVTILVKNAKSQITSKQLQVLLGFAEEDIYDSSRQATAFGLLKVFLWSKWMGFVNHWNGSDYILVGVCKISCLEQSAEYHWASLLQKRKTGKKGKAAELSCSTRILCSKLFGRLFDTHRITELLRLEKTSKITWSNHQPIPTMPTNHVLSATSTRFLNTFYPFLEHHKYILEHMQSAVCHSK